MDNLVKSGNVLKSMLASDEAIIDIKEHYIERLKVIIELFKEATPLSKSEFQSVSYGWGSYHPLQEYLKLFFLLNSYQLPWQ